MSPQPTSPASAGVLAPRAATAIAGVALVVVAAVTSGPGIEARLLGQASGRLEWGPDLFRALLAFHGLALIAAAALAMRRASRPAAAPSALPPALPGSRTWLALAALAAVALTLRLWRLGTDLWLDEVLTWADFARRPLAEIVTMFPNQNQHMLYSVLAHVSMTLFGDGAAALRLPAVLFGVASVPALWLLGSRTNGPREAWLASLLMTFAYHHVWFSQNARGYTGLLLFTILSTWLFLEALSRDRAGWWIAYGASLVAGLWIHMTMLFVPAAHGVVLVLRLVRPAPGPPPGRLLAHAATCWLFTGTVTAQLYALSLPEFFRSALHEVSLESEWTSPGWVLRETLRRLGGSGPAGIGAIGAIAVMTAGWVSLLRRSWPAALAMLLPGVLGGGAMIALGHNLWPRFFFFCLGFILLAAVRGAMVVPGLVFGRIAPRIARTVGVGLVAGALLAAVVTLPRVYALPKQDYSGARDFVDGMRAPGDAAVAVGLAGTAFARYFAPDWPTPQTAAELEALRRSHPTVWLVYTLPIQLRAWHPDIWEAIESRFEVVRVFPGTLGGGQVVVARSRSADAGDRRGP